MDTIVHSKLLDGTWIQYSDPHQVLEVSTKQHCDGQLREVRSNMTGETTI